MAPDVTSVYYTFSTIAQTLAAIVGILAAFAIMRLSELSTRIAAELPSFSSHCQYGEAFAACIATGDFDAAISLVHEGGLDSTESLVFDACRRSTAERKRLLMALRRSLLVGGIVIAYSVACLPLANLIASSRPLTWSALGGGFIGLCTSLIVVATLAPVPKTRRRRRMVGAPKAAK